MLALKENILNKEVLKVCYLSQIIAEGARCETNIRSRITVKKRERKDIV